MSTPAAAKTPRATTSATVEDILALVRESGGRVTMGRRLLLEVLLAADGHRTAEELAAAVQARAPDVNMSTIYRNLDEFENLGVVIHAHLGHGPATYHLAATAHSHLVCEVCNAVIEIPDRMFAGLARTARARFGFELDPHHFAVLGRCEACQ